GRAWLCRIRACARSRSDWAPVPHAGLPRARGESAPRCVLGCPDGHDLNRSLRLHFWGQPWTGAVNKARDRKLELIPSAQECVDPRRLIVLEPAVEDASPKPGHVGNRSPVALCEGIGIGYEGLPCAISKAFRIDLSRAGQQFSNRLG